MYLLTVFPMANTQDCKSLLIAVEGGHINSAQYTNVKLLYYYYNVVLVHSNSAMGLKEKVNLTG